MYTQINTNLQNLLESLCVLPWRNCVQHFEFLQCLAMSMIFWLLILVGWGRTHLGPPANTLQQAKLPLVSHNDCKKTWRTIDSSAHLCAGEGRAGASGGCNGDSGGPLVCEIGDRWYLHGAVSFGMKDCPTTHYTVFTRITSYISWILQKIGRY